MTWVILLISLSAQLGGGCTPMGNGLGEGKGDCRGFFEFRDRIREPCIPGNFSENPNQWRPLAAPAQPQFSPTSFIEIFF